MIHWDANVSLGTVIEIGSFLVILYGFHRTNIVRITRMEDAYKKLTAIEDAVNKLPAMETKVDAIWEWFLTRNHDR